VIDLGSLSDHQRRQLWLELVPEGDPTEVTALASRYHVPPATAMAVLERVGPSVPGIERALRSSLGEALRSVAEPVDHLPRWHEVVLDPELSESLRELVARRRHLDRVCFDWGMDSAMRSARGLVALFSGPPGTGKTLAAGLVARELDRELYRVDLSRVVSKWIGETEKHLATLFEAAEQADAVVLFDEADSLFAKRTAVKGANDRNANLEVNYILQRLDTFRGVAILTTNQKASIDPAFRRRLTAQLHFSLPDAETRERLWRAHLPKTAPVDPEIDFADLAARYPFTGGQIRNIAVRAAFLAAACDATLSQTHFQRAIELEYRERGKLSASGRLE
jgi:SpoVK/Ycf46/Vps4 family AAA+-type ATPase